MSVPIERECRGIKVNYNASICKLRNSSFVLEPVSLKLDDREKQKKKTTANSMRVVVQDYLVFLDTVESAS